MKNIFVISIFFFLLNLTIKLIFIVSRDIALDEPFSIFFAQQTPGEIIQYFNSANENNPPFYFLLLHYWIKFFGMDALSVRLLSVILSSATAVVIFRIGQKYFNIQTGIFASLIFTFSTLHIYYSHEARTYSLFSLLATFSLFFYLEILKNPVNKKNYYFLFLSNLILIYSHYFGFFIVFTEALCFLFLPNKKNAWKNFLMVFLLLGGFYLPHFFVAFQRFILTKNSGTWVAAPAITEYYGNLNRFLNIKYCMMLLITVLAIACVLLLREKIFSGKLKELFSNLFVKNILLWFFIPYTLMFLISFKLPMFIDRYILYTSIPFYIFIALIFNFLIIEKKLYYVLCSLLILSLMITVKLNPDNNRRLKDATDAVRNLKKENTIILIAPYYADLSFMYHYDINLFRDYKNMYKHMEKEKIFAISTADMTRNILENHNGDCVYFQADTQFSDPDNLILQGIAKKYSKHTESNFFEIYTIHHFSN